MPTLEHSLASESGSLETTLTGITPAGTNRYGLVTVGRFESRSVDSITWGGVDITANVVKSAGHDGVGRKILGMYYYLDPPASAADVVVSLSGTGSTFDVFVEAEAWSGVDQTTPYENLTATADDEGQTASPASISVASEAGSAVKDAYYQWDNGEGTTAVITVGAGQTSIQELEGNSGNGACFGASYEAGAASVTMSWDNSDSASPQWCMYAISLNAAAGASIFAKIAGERFGLAGGRGLAG